MQRTLSHLIAWLLLLAVLPGVFASAPPPKPAIVELPEIPRARRSLSLAPLWRLGGDDEAVLLGLVTAGVLDADGKVLLADQQLSHVVVVSPAGEILGTLGREGEGPGETRNLEGLFVTGRRVGMVQGYPGKVIYLDYKGLPAGGFALGQAEDLGGFYAIRALRSCGEVLVAHLDRSTEDPRADRSTQRSSLAVLTPDGELRAELAVHDVVRGMRRVVLDEAAAWHEFASWAISPRGRVATVASRDSWAVNEYRLDGTLERILRRPCQPRRRSAEEMDEAVSRIRLASFSAGATLEKKPMDTDPVIVDLQYAADGRLFVCTCHNATAQLPRGIAGRYDVISPEGTYLEELTLVLPSFDPQRDRLLFLDGKRYLVLRNFEDAERALYAAFLPEAEREDLGAAQPLEVLLVEAVDAAPTPGQGRP